MFRKEVYSSSSREKSTDVVLNPEWEKNLASVLNNIEQNQSNLAESTRNLFDLLSARISQANSEGKRVNFTFLTRQGVPVYWLLKGAFDAKESCIPDSNVLGVSAVMDHAGMVPDHMRKHIPKPALHFDPNEEKKLKDIIHANENNSLTFFIDESRTAGRSIGACFSLVSALGANLENYSWATLFERRSEVAPWDAPGTDELGNGDPFDPGYFSTHMYLAPERYDNKHHVVAVPTLNQNPNVQVCVARIANKLYKIGISTGSEFE